MAPDRILTTHVGSLVRPEPFADLLRRRRRGDVSEGGYQVALTAAVSAVVEQQAAVGIDIVSDGEYGKGIGWEQYVLERLSGFASVATSTATTDAALTFGDARRFPEFYAEYWATQQLTEGVYPCTGPVLYTGHSALARDIQNLKAAMAKYRTTGGFLPLAAPGSAVGICPNHFYRNDEEYLFAVAEALRQEYSAVCASGLSVQIDDAYLPYMHDCMVPPATEADYRRWAQIRIDALKHALRGLPAERLRYHICWGSWNAPHVTDVPLTQILDLLLQLPVGGFSFEAANPRHEHEWSVWRGAKLAGRKLYPGVVTHSTNVVEHPDLVAERIVRFVEVAGRDNVIASTDCGFAQGPFVRRVHPSIQWAKLEALVEGAAKASRRLWPQ